jgi:HEAT repeat protein
MDNRLRAWTNLTLTASTEADYRKWKVLEEDIVYRATRRKEELLEQLETGPPTNRMIAAMSLGFVRPPEEGDKVVGPLLNALGDQDPQVVNNAVVALGMLASPETPVAPIAALLVDSSDDRLRLNAALALRKVVEAGAVWEPKWIGEVRHGLIDTDHGVVAQSALLLGLIADVESIESLTPLLVQEPPLVCSAAAKALALIGSRVPESKGACARALVLGFTKAPEALRPRVHRALVELASRDYGDDEDAWNEWAQRQP